MAVKPARGFTVMELIINISFSLFVASVNGLAGRSGPKSGGGGFCLSKAKTYKADFSDEIKRFMEFLEREECEGIDATEIGFHRDNNLRGVFAKESGG